MGRIVNVMGIAIAVAAAGAVYHVKHEAGRAAATASELQREIERERASIAVLRAEWSHLNHPARLQGLAERYLELRPVEARQFVSLAELPARPVPQIEPIPLEAAPAEIAPFEVDAVPAEPVDRHRGAPLPVGGMAGNVRNIQ